MTPSVIDNLARLERLARDLGDEPEALAARVLATLIALGLITETPGDIVKHDGPLAELSREYGASAVALAALVAPEHWAFVEATQRLERSIRDLRSKYGEFSNSTPLIRRWRQGGGETRCPE